MEKKIIIGAVVVAIGFIGSAWLSRNNQTSEPLKSSIAQKIDFNGAVGKKAPDFELEGMQGKVRLSDYLGKVVVLFFNEGSMCYPACWNQIAELGNDARFNTGSVAAFPVVVDPKSQWLDIVARSMNMANARILFDTSRSVSKMYGVLNLNSSMHPGRFPGHTYFVIDRQGIIRFTLDDPNMALANDRLIQEIEKIQ